MEEPGVWQDQDGVWVWGGPVMLTQLGLGRKRAGGETSCFLFGTAEAAVEAALVLMVV